MNFLNKITIFLPVLVLLSGCYDRTDQTLSPPENARRVTVSVKVPDGITLLPMQMLYRSERCKTKSYDSSNEAYEIRGYNGFKQAFSTQGSNGIRQQRIAIDGGGPCQWQLNSIKVSFRIADDNPLVKGKEVIETSYIFDFGDYGLSDGYGTGRAIKANGNLDLKADFFPMVSHHIGNSASLKFFGGDTELEKWRRRFMLNNTQTIFIEPTLHFTKVVTLDPPDRPGNIIATYPDGSREEIPHISPDYEKLLSMK
ncbi:MULTISPECIES: hypothetical protein [Rahnella]|uniref:Lipoprotein n=1 Tax=Rahnella laticis TaxID=2787622 RepID=A0ABS0E2X6_9GAMM|nr:MULTISPECIES: hypothetical protein [Rahnella]MBF7978528.1 hypothetical protein [Rahnella laticis]MBF7998618.1 hypothetical protein [Rahnella sp. LAC-M12]